MNSTTSARSGESDVERDREPTYLPHLKKSIDVLTYTYIVAGYFCDSSSALLLMRVIPQFLFLGPRSLVAALRPPSYLGMLSYILFANIYAIVVLHGLLHQGAGSQLFVPSWTVSAPVGFPTLWRWLRGSTEMLPAPVLPSLDETSKLMNHIYPGGVPGVTEGTMVEYINPATRNHGGLLSFEFTGNVLESTARLILSDVIILFLQLCLFSLIVMPHYKNSDTNDSTADDPQGQRLGTFSDESDESNSSQDPLLSGEQEQLTPRQQMIEDRISGRSVAGEIAIWPAVTNVIRDRHVNRYHEGDDETAPPEEQGDLQQLRFMRLTDLERQQPPEPAPAANTPPQNMADPQFRSNFMNRIGNWARSVGTQQTGGQRLGTQPNDQ
ncbi:hypothetical protein CJU90_4212 [Yarrowia sp. C11]|nr:hypothetical protein CKK34_6497 [Yarrowia sp. E02]KAG5365154.1 hypothetical protein CJU90_4212 [Yarrowia sp. C11]